VGGVCSTASSKAKHKSSQVNSIQDSDYHSYKY